MNEARNRRDNSETWLTAIKLLSTGIGRIAMHVASRVYVQIRIGVWDSPYSKPTIQDAIIPPVRDDEVRDARMERGSGTPCLHRDAAISARPGRRRARFPGRRCKFKRSRQGAVLDTGVQHGRADAQATDRRTYCCPRNPLRHGDVKSTNYPRLLPA